MKNKILIAISIVGVILIAYGFTIAVDSFRDKPDYSEAATINFWTNVICNHTEGELVNNICVIDNESYQAFLTVRGYVLREVGE